MSESLTSRARGAAKWSLATELLARIVSPVTQLALARLLAPEAFGILATVVMVTSFAQMLSDAGFQRYLIQREFDDQRHLDRSANVAFWSSFAVAVALLVVITLLRDSLAVLVGNPGLGIPLVVASFSLPMSVIVGTQQALFLRSFEYRIILPARVGSSLVVLVVSVSLALAGLGYWSLIVGTLCGTLANAIAITAVSPWKPGRFYSFKLFRAMFAFSGWSLLEAVSIWLTVWAGTFVVGSLLGSHELGLYRQPMTVVNSIFALVTASTTPVLFSALSRLQNDRRAFHHFFLRFQFVVSVFILPVGVGAFFYREFLTSVLFGDQWSEATLMFGTWSLSTCVMIVFSHYCSEVFRALGKPHISLLSQCLYMTLLIPALYFAALDGFTTLVIVNATIRLAAILINQFLTFFVAGISFLQVIKNIYAPLIGLPIMGGTAAWLAPLAGDSWLWSIAGIATCAFVYAASCLCFPKTRKLLLSPIINLRRRSR